MATAVNIPAPLILTGNLSANWRMFYQNFEIFLIASNNNEKDDSVKVALLLNVIGQEGVDLFNTFNLTDAERKDLNTVKTKFQNHTTPKVNVTFERYVFNNRSQKEGETFDQYVIELRKIAKSCEFDNLRDSLLRDRIIIGIRNQHVREALLRTEDLTLDKAISYCQSAEISQAQAAQMDCGQTSSVDAVNSKSRKYHQPYKSNFKQGSSFHPKQSSAYHSKHSSSASHHKQSHSSYGNKQPTSSRSNGSSNCIYCGTQHPPRNCPAYGVKCTKCKKSNHFAAMCKSARSVHYLDGVDDENSFSDSDELEYLEEIKVVPCDSVNSSSKEWFQKVFLENSLVNFKLDIGASVNTISLEIFNKLNSAVLLQPTSISLQVFGGQIIKPVGQANLMCQVNGKVMKLNFQIVNETTQPLLGLQACSNLNLVKRVEAIKSTQVNVEKNKLINSNPELFKGLGKFPEKFNIKIKDNSILPNEPPRRIPSSLKSNFKKALDKLINQGIIEKVDEISTNHCVSNLVVVEKQNGDLRFCLDPQALNDLIITQHYLLPTTAEISEKLQFNKFYSVFDLKDGYHQIELDETSSNLCCFSTPFGIFKYKRLPFGISCASETFQERNERIFGDISNVLIYQDDILVFAKTEAEHDRAVQAIIQRALQYGIKFNSNKLQYKQSSVKYVGFVFSEEGRRLDDSRVEALLSIESPSTKKELQRCIGMFNYVRDFIPNMSAIIAPLRNLLKDDIVFQWLPIHEKSFNELKNLVANSPVLVNFNPSVAIEIQCDASQNGLGCVLLQNKQPVAFASASLTPAEQNYSQSEKELRAIDFSLHKFHNYVYGYKILIKTDHKPLVPLMSKPVHKIGSSVLRRIRLKLFKYKLKVEYLPGPKMYIADLLSRSFLKTTSSDDTGITEIVHSIVKHLPMSDSRKHEFLQETSSDSELSLLKQLYLNGWPSHKHQVPDLVKWAWSMRYDIYVDSDLVFYNDRLCVPKALTSLIMNLLHSGHNGRDKTLAKAQQVYYWRNMHTDISNLVATCNVCQKFQPMKVKSPMITPYIPYFPFEVVALDILQTLGKNFLILIDLYSRWIEICPIKQKTATSVIEKLKTIFCTHGIPKRIQADNNPFNSQEFLIFARTYDIELITCSPHYHRGNGMAEKACHIAEQILKKSNEQKVDYRELLLEYRNTPLAKLNVSPSQILMSRQARTFLPVSSSTLEPKVVKDLRLRMLENQQKSKVFYDKTASHTSEDFNCGDNVLIKCNKTKDWTPGTIIEKHSAPRSYIVQQQNGSQLRRNETHLKAFKGQVKQTNLNVPPYDLSPVKSSLKKKSEETQPTSSSTVVSESVPQPSSSSTIVSDSVPVPSVSGSPQNEESYSTPISSPIPVLKSPDISVVYQSNTSASRQDRTKPTVSNPVKVKPPLRTSKKPASESSQASMLSKSSSRGRIITPPQRYLT